MFDQGIEVDPEKVESVKNWSRPLKPIDIQSFLGLANYYHMWRAFPLFQPHLQLNKKKVKFEWS